MTCWENQLLSIWRLTDERGQSRVLGGESLSQRGELSLLLSHSYTGCGEHEGLANLHVDECYGEYEL